MMDRIKAAPETQALTRSGVVSPTEDEIQIGYAHATIVRVHI